MNKNKKRNAFFYFMLDWKDKKEKQGLHFPKGIKDVQSNPQCNKDWHDLPEIKKNEYKQKAQQTNNTVVKKNAIGVPIDEIVKAETEKSNFNESMKEYLTLKINKARELNYVQKLKFYVVHTNYYYKRTINGGEDVYRPAEIGIAEFSLQDGITRVYHKIINPKIETGYAADAREHSKISHQLPTLVGNIGEGDYDIIYEEICKFLEPGREEGKLPPLFTQYCDEMILHPVISVLNQLSENGDEKIAIYSLEELYIRLHNIYNLDGYRKLDSIEVHTLLKKDPHDYENSTACDFHKDVIGMAKYCSKSCPQRWIYSLCYNCCPFLDIDLRPGFHCPSTEDMTLKFERMDLVGNPRKYTGAVKKYTKNKSERSHHEEEIRRFDGPPLRITDYGKEGAAEEKVKVTSEESLRHPFTKPMSLIMDTSNSLYNDDFPSLSIGRGRRIRNDTTPSKCSWASKLK